MVFSTKQNVIPAGTLFYIIPVIRFYYSTRSGPVPQHGGVSLSLLIIKERPGLFPVDYPRILQDQ